MNQLNTPIPDQHTLLFFYTQYDTIHAVAKNIQVTNHWKSKTQVPFLQDQLVNEFEHKKCRLAEFQSL